MSQLPENMKVQWLGHSGFSIVSPGGLKILIDPWFEHPLKVEGAKEKAIEDGIDIILLTHGHSDHIGNTVEIAKATKCKVVAIYEVMLFLAQQGVPQEQLVGINKGGTFREGDLRATMVDASHSAGIDVDGKVVASGGEAAGFILRFDANYTVYHAGDTALLPGLKETITDVFHPDLLMVPIGDLFTMGPELAAIFTKKVDPKIVIPIHWGTFPLLTGTPEKFAEELGDLKDRLVTLTVGQTI